MAKKKYQVIKATKRDIPGVYVGGRKKTFDSRGTFVTDDKGEAEEIEKVLGRKGTGEVVVTPYHDNQTKEPGHRYTFASTSRYRAAWEEFEKRKKRTTRRKGAEVDDGIQRD